MLPKAESLAQVRHAAQTGVDIIPILETAEGILNAAEIAATPGVQRLAFGSLDYGLDLGLTPDTEGANVVLDHARVQVLLRSKAADLPAPLDGWSDSRDTAAPPTRSFRSWLASAEGAATMRAAAEEGARRTADDRTGGERTADTRTADDWTSGDRTADDRTGGDRTDGDRTADDLPEGDHQEEQ